MGFTVNENMVRVDFWKPSGKWYDTVELEWDNYGSREYKIGDELIHDTFRRCLKEQFSGHYKGMLATCLEPYHINSHPISTIHEG